MDTVKFKYVCPECGKRYDISMDISMAEKANRKFYRKVTPCSDCVIRLFRRKNR